MTKRYSSKPFISYDGIDEKGNRAEVEVITGYGNVEDISMSKAGNAGNVSFTVDNTDYPPKGWAPVDSNVMEAVNKAQDENATVHFRIEKRRKDHVDRELPLSEVAPKGDAQKARDNIVRSLAAVKFDDGEWIISPHAVTRIEEDPSTGGGYSAYNHSIDELKPQKKASGNGNGNGNNSFHPLESTPFFTKNKNGELNPGSLAVSVPLSIYNFVEKQNREKELNLDTGTVFKVVQNLLNLTSELQLEIYDGELTEPDWSLGSHTRARALVFDLVENTFPMTSENASNNEKLSEWLEQVHERAMKLWKWSIGIVEKTL